MKQAKNNLGFASEDELLDQIAIWHEDQPPCKLHEFLGVTEKEYKDWVTNSLNYAKTVILEIKGK